MPSPHHAHAQAHLQAHAPHQSGAASATSLPASAYNSHLNPAGSSSNPSATSASASAFSASNPASRSTTPASQFTLHSARNPSLHAHPHVQQQQPYYDPAVPVSRPVYPSAYANANNPSHIANSASHITSAISVPPSQTSTAFFPASLPRTSSLLPPPRITVNESSWKQAALHDPFNASAIADPVNDRDLDDPVSPKNTRRRSSQRTHSRSSSLGGLSDGFRNLNRWSISTASSRASNAGQSTRNRFSRRLSVDSTNLFSHSNQATSPRRLQKSRPSTASGSPEDRRPSIPPLTSLPPVIPLLSFDQEDIERATLSRAESRQESTAYNPRFGDDPATAHETSYLATSVRQTPESSLPSSAFSRDATMPHPEDAGTTFEKGHSRGRSQGFKSSTDSASSPRTRDRTKQPSQKAMLSKALQKANTAVQLDNAQNFEGARNSYYEACDLLHQVLLRTPGDDDKKKLEAIRKTYSSRIEELNQMLPPDSDEIRGTPQTPASNSTGSMYMTYDRSRNASIASTADDVQQFGRQRSDTVGSQQSIPNYARPTSAAWRSRHSPKPSFDGPRYVTPTPNNYDDAYDRSKSSFSQRSPRRVPSVDQDVFLSRPMDGDYMPPPLSPRRPISPGRRSDGVSPQSSGRADSFGDRNRLAPEPSGHRGHQRTGSHESISWLDPIDESGDSSVSSVHSRSSSMRVRRKHIRAASGDTEAEFDAALDDAIEAAYDDGYEPAGDMDEPVGVAQVVGEDDVIAQALKKVQLAKERVRQSELEMQRLANDRGRRMRALQEEEEDTLPGDFYDGNDSDEEERILAEITSGYAVDDFAFGDPAKARPPRQSDSSEVTSRTWHSSTVSNAPTASTALSTVTETLPPAVSKSSAPIAPPPTQSLPKLPTHKSSASRDSVRDRRLSGLNPKQLKIETQTLGPKMTEPATAGPTMQNSELPFANQPKTAGPVAQQRQTLSTAPSRSSSMRRGPSPMAPGLFVDGPPPTPPVPANFQDSENRAGSPAVNRPPTLRKNFSSSSLKNMKTRNLSISNFDEYSDVSPSTPLSNPFVGPATARLPALPSMPTPVASAFRDRMTSASGTVGFRLFESDIHSPRSPGTPNPAAEAAPAPLEPCPKDSMLRPFWLMRALYQTLCHPKGGYVSNKLFVPRDAWRVKGVKIKNVEDKISQCDLLTAALQKLGRVNSDDADAVLEEMQSLETVLEQVQIFLTRRLGNEVGVQGAGIMFKDAEGVTEADGKPIPRNNSVSGKGAFSWKRLRNKTSSNTMSNAYERGSGRKDSIGLGATDGGLSTLPLTDHPTSKPSKRDIMSVQFSGPNAHYMAALARLFDAAQAIDQIARQVEDPGLRHQDKTQVGLELSTRHAAEFFAFYICRFVLQDLTMLLDKFIKRGSEWVLV